MSCGIGIQNGFAGFYPGFGFLPQIHVHNPNIKAYDHYSAGGVTYTDDGTIVLANQSIKIYREGYGRDGAKKRQEALSKPGIHVSIPKYDERYISDVVHSQAPSYSNWYSQTQNEIQNQKTPAEKTFLMRADGVGVWI